MKEKSLAALRAGIKTVMVPRRNAKDLEDIPAEAKAKLEFVFLERVEDAVNPDSRSSRVAGSEEKKAA